MKIDNAAVVEILQFYKEIDGEITIYRQMLQDYENQYYSTVGAMMNDGQPKGKNQISRQVENAVINIPDYVRSEMKTYAEKVSALQMVINQILKEVSGLRLKEKRIIYDF